MATTVQIYVSIAVMNGYIILDIVMSGIYIIVHMILIVKPPPLEASSKSKEFEFSSPARGTIPVEVK